MCKLYKPLFLFGISFLSIFFFAGTAKAQFGARIPIVDAAKNYTTTTVRRKPRTSSVRKVNTKIITKTERVRISNLAVTTAPGARVLLESAIKTAKSFSQEKIADEKGSVIFDDLKPGNYNVSASKEDFETLQTNEPVTISPQKPHSLDMDLKPTTYKLKIETNLKGGEVFYAQALYKGVDASGAIISEKLGNYCVVKIEPNGDALIPDLKKGYYDLDIRPETLEFEQKLTGLKVPENTEQDEAGAASEIKTFQIDLETKISRETFGTTAWAKDDWIMPASWRLERGMKVNNAPGIALPRDPRYRYYTNFEMISNVKLHDGGSAGFALRAIDENNYYFVQISGARAAEPNMAALYSVKKGQMQQINSATTAPFASSIASKNGFRVIIRGDEKGFKISIEDTDTGQVHAVGLMPDPYNTFQKGAVGIASRTPSNFEINYFEVCTPVCP